MPYNEDNIEDKFWPDEPWDKFLPHKGFITDLVLMTRGIKTPSKFTAWSAIFAISSVLKRDTWLKWYPGKFYGNLYIFIVAPPSICGKSYVAKKVLDERIFRDYEYYVSSEEMKIRKKLRIFHSSITEAGIITNLKPASKVSDPSTGKRIEIGSDAVFIVSEIANLLGKQSHKIGLIERLISLYDCDDSDDSTTKQSGKEELKNIYITIIGASTKTGLAESIPSTAWGDGFLSRVIILNQDYSTRVYPFPKEIVGGPTVEEMKARLAWIAENSTGEYEFSPEAKHAYEVWYPEWNRKLQSDPKKEHFRLDIHLVKLSLIMRSQRYEPGRIIELRDFNDALKILNSTIGDTERATSEVGIDFIGKARETIEPWLRKKEKVSRRELARTFSGRKINSKVLNLVLTDLVDLNKIKITLDKKQRLLPSVNSREEYEWIDG